MMLNFIYLMCMWHAWESLKVEVALPTTGNVSSLQNVYRLADSPETQSVCF